METVSEIKDNNLHINLIGELTEYTVASAREEMNKAMEDKSIKKVIINCERLTFIDSTGIGVLIGRYKEMKIRNVPVFVEDVNEQVDKIFKLSGLYEIFPKYSAEKNKIKQSEVELKLEILSDSINESFAKATVANFLVKLKPTLEELNDVKTLVNEAVTNAIIHGYESKKDGKIEIAVALKDRTATISVADYGVGIKDKEKAVQPFFTTKPEQERTGMGFTLMENFADSVSVSDNEPSGTIVTLTKTFGGV